MASLWGTDFAAAYEESRSHCDAIAAARRRLLFATSLWEEGWKPTEALSCLAPRSVARPDTAAGLWVPRQGPTPPTSGNT
jgi:hypothetical protein